jgi:hypothetical protein
MIRMSYTAICDHCHFEDSVTEDYTINSTFMTIPQPNNWRFVIFGNNHICQACAAVAREALKERVRPYDAKQ